MRPEVIAVLLASGLAAVTTLAQTPAPKVGPARGTIFAVGGGVVPEILTKFLETAGGPSLFSATRTTSMPVPLRSASWTS